MKKAKASNNGWMGFVNQLCENFLAAKAEKKTAELNYNSAKAAVVGQMNGALTIETDRFTAVYANNKKQTLDVERLKTERPDIYSQYLRETDCLVLTVNTKAAAAKVA